jgi:2-oxo-4-hydroxy-4-carboxy-5-ureidoimidazoline decarboxylase
VNVTGVAAFDALPEAECRAALERCCGSSRWVAAMLAARPFKSREELLADSERAFGSLQRADWLEAFSHHPKIGDVDALREKFASTARWAGEEQKGAAVADERTLIALAEGNRDYLKQFGYIFIVCATGKSAAEMLDLLDARLGNAPEFELAIAASEQKKITRLRLEKLLGAL